MSIHRTATRYNEPIFNGDKGETGSTPPIALVAAGAPGKVALTSSTGKSPPPAAKMLLIGEFGGTTDCQELEQHMNQFEQSGISIRLDQLEGQSQAEKIQDLERVTDLLREEGYIDATTEICIAVHGEKQGDTLFLSTSDEKFEVEATQLLEMLGRGKDSPASAGTIQFSVCESKILHEKLMNFPHNFIFYSGSKSIFTNPSNKTLKKQIEFSFSHQNATALPEALLNNAKKYSGSNLVMSGNKKLRHIKISDVIRNRATVDTSQLADHFLYKFGTGSFESVVSLLEDFCLSELMAVEPDPKNLIAFAVESDKNALEKVALLLLLGANPNAQEGNGNTGLHAACQYGDDEMIKCLLQNGGLPDIKNHDGYTPRDLAFRRGHLEAVKCIDEFQSGERHPRYSQNNLLFGFCSKTHREALRALILQNKALLNTRNVKGDSLLIHSIRKKTPVIATDLLDAGIDPNAANQIGNTALHYTCIAGARTKLIRDLRKKGADFNAKNHRGFTPLIYAARNGLTDHAKHLVRFTANVNEPSLKGNTALHFAVSRNDFDMVKTLLDLGADRHSKNVFGFSPVDRARKKGFDAIASLLDHYQPQQINYH